VQPDQILERLDPEQREAAISLVGPTCILAGAGTGKTRTVTHRIAYGIAKGYFAANRILALTYTNRAAGELRARLRQLGITGVSVKTFHAAALAQLQYFWPQFAGIPAPSVIESKAKLIFQVADSLKLKFDTAAIRDIAAEIEWRKFSMLSLDDYEQVATNRPKVTGLSAEVLVQLQRGYEEAKIASNRLDWEDVLILTLGMLRAEPRALAHVQQQYRFFTVDEYQDISPLQHELLDLWLGDHQDLCVVGDPNQTIYSFTGATSEYLHNFANRYEAATLVSLTRNYRSTQEIVSFANKLTRDATDMSPLVSQGALGTAPLIRSFESLADEANAIAKSISDRLEQGISPAEIAVLYRVNGQAEPIEHALSALGIDYQVRGGERYFSRQDVQQALAAFRVEALSSPDAPSFEAVSKVLRSLGWTTTPPIEPGAAYERWEALNALMQILEEQVEELTLADFSKELEERVRSQHEPVKAAVTLATMHSAKGLEWDVVYLAGLTDGYLPIGYAKTETEIAEERRLFYVGVTRARKQLSLSYPSADVPGGRKREPSRFLKLVTA
jgi:DNA helicase-2/ATP-dependent DNA helicase PcrA